MGERSTCVTVPHHARGARLARQGIGADLSKRIDDEFLADITMIVSELVGNSVLHARPLPDGGVRVAWQLGQGRIALRVTDGGATHAPQAIRVGPDETSGRGLNIVEALSDRWGVIRDGLGQCVWVELDRPEHMARSAQTVP